MDLKVPIPEPFPERITPGNMSTPTIVNDLTNVDDKGSKKQERDLEATVSSENADVAAEPLQGFQRFLFLPLLCSAQFFDIFNATSVIIALPEVGGMCSAKRINGNLLSDL